MTRLLTLLLLLSLPAFAQAVRPPPRPPPASTTPPAHTPGFYPGTPAEPVYTPPGTGLPTPGQPGAAAVPVPRSPNTRILPAASEPGLWAADGAPKAATGEPHPKIGGMEIPFPRGAYDEVAKYNTRNCADHMNYALTRSGKYFAMDRQSEAERLCIAARLYKHCADALQGEYARKMPKGSFDRAAEESIRATRATADKFVKDACGERILSDEGADVVKGTTETWDQLRKAMPL